MHLLPDYLFIQEIAKIGGTPSEFFENRQLLDLFIPIMKADYKLIETHVYKPSAELLDVGLSVLCGDQYADVLVDDLKKWDKLRNINAPSTYYMVVISLFLISIWRLLIWWSKH